MRPSEPVEADSIAPITEGLLRLSESRCRKIVEKWGRLQTVTMLHGAGCDTPLAPSIRDLAMACYAQGCRDAVAVAATMEAKPDAAE